MHPTADPSPVVHNFKKRFLRHYSRPRQAQRPVSSHSDSQANASDTEYLEQMNNSATQRQCATVTSETIYVPGCTCVFCAMRPEADDVAVVTPTASQPNPRNLARRSLPSLRSVMEVLYPPSYLGVPSPFPPPSYSRNDCAVYPTRGDDAEISPLIPSTTAGVEEVPVSQRPIDPLAQEPSLTGVPTQCVPSASSRVPPVEPSPPMMGLDDVPEEPLPAYSRFDHRQPRFPAASDILGPYPPLSVFRPSSS